MTWLYWPIVARELVSVPQPLLDGDLGYSGRFSVELLIWIKEAK